MQEYCEDRTHCRRTTFAKIFGDLGGEKGGRSTSITKAMSSIGYSCGQSCDNCMYKSTGKRRSADDEVSVGGGGVAHEGDGRSDSKVLGSTGLTGGITLPGRATFRRASDMITSARSAS